MTGYFFLHYFFLIFHTVFTLFNCVGWILKRTRKTHLITMSLTAFSWFVVGIWRGWGYCFCTDWHFEVLSKLEMYPKSRSYIHYLIREVTGMNLNESLVIDYTLYVFVALIIITIYQHTGGIRKKMFHGFSVKS